MDRIVQEQHPGTGATAALMEANCILEAEDDPLLCKVPLPFQAVFYPLGFAVEIATNSQGVLEAAAESWGTLRQRHTNPTLRIRVVVSDAGSEECPPEPVVRAHRYVLSSVADRNNQAICDLRERIASIWVNRGALRHRAYLRYHFIEAIAFTLIATSYVMPIHAACVSFNGCGLLLCGESGAGKSSLAYACARAGWTYTSDDASYLLHSADQPRIIGNPVQFRFRPSARALFPILLGRSLTPRARGKPSIEVPTSEMSGIHASEEADPRYAIFLNRQPYGPAELLQLPKERALEYFGQNAYPMEVVGNTWTAAREYLSALSMRELRYADLDEAVALLERLARSSD